VLCQLSYAPGSSARRAVYPRPEYAQAVRAPTQRRALGVLFLLLAALFAGIAVAGTNARVWPVAIAGLALCLWMIGLVARAWRG
jgi:hypothetical protein